MKKPPEDDTAERFIGTMDLIRDVLEGRREKPGGKDCYFPHCVCNQPWGQCEMKKND